MSQMHIGTVLQSFLVSEEHEINICDAVCRVKKSLDTQNKILMKMMGLMEKMSK